MARPTYKKGDLVAIMNRGFDGTYFFEGHAIVVSKGHVNGQYRVRFDDGDVCYRFVDPEAQDRPFDYAKRLNEQAGAQ